MGDGLRFGVLGPVEAWRGDDEPVALGSPQQVAVFVRLLLAGSWTVSADEIIHAVWGEEPADGALGIVRTYVARLRKRLEPERARGATGGLLASVGSGYALRADADALDLTVFNDLTTRAAEVRGAGGAGEAAELYRRGLALWRGVPLAGVPGPYAETQRTWLVEASLNARQALLECELELGRHRDVVAEASAMIAEHPLREQLYEALMLALYRSGRQAEALAAYADARRLLDEELGVEPGLGLREMHRKILCADPALAAPVWPGAVDIGAARAAGPPPTAAQEQALAEHSQAPRMPVPAQLPADLPDFSGRRVAIEKIRDALTDASVSDSAVIVTVSGMGGVGKSTLATHAAHAVADRFPDGCLYVDLRGADDRPADPADVLGRFLTALGTAPNTVPTTLEERAALFRTILTSRRVLILLDNASDAAQVRPLLPGAPGNAAVVTSRPHLVGLPTAASVGLEVMDGAEAAELLGRIVGPDRTGIAGPAAAELVAACGYLPLAVRIVGARLAARPSWTVQDIARRLADEQRRLRELRTGDLSIEGCFALSYHQLDPDAAQAFRLLATVSFPDMGLAGAASIIGLDPLDAGEAEDLLESLVDLGLLESPLPGRYRYHDLVHVYARDLALAIDGAQEADACLARLLDMIQATALNGFRLAQPGSMLPDSLEPARSPGQTFADAAETRAVLAVRLPATLAVLRQAIAGTAEHLSAAARALVLLSVDPQWQRDMVTSVAEALADAAARTGDRQSEARARYILDYHRLGSAEFLESVVDGGPDNRTVELCRTVGDRILLTYVLDTLGCMWAAVRRREEALACLDEARELALATGNRQAQAAVDSSMAYTLVSCGGDLEAAVEHGRRCVELSGELADTENVMVGLYLTGWALQGLGQYDEAEALYDECIRLCQAGNTPNREAGARFRIATLRAAAGRHQEAVAIAEYVLAGGEAFHDGWLRAHALGVLAGSLPRLGQGERAEAARREAFEIFTDLGLVAEADALRASTGQ
ncbi:winged helix-turn-helix domain-containing protein [Catenulispora sp. NF23]|uniref:AfsR/SARP family transcriptional regulator n=1 Tax=Catenulispora pinistramenti TaxID=2705254 RepID=UPI001BA7AA31|nr:BTAD domain-containing putative transcriptional regulator [Catenulispora pinistramenti]MBS2533947.1 winged helix-turn-helix domain-containing protein [Catenulispora pinistramenti]